MYEAKFRSRLTAPGWGILFSSLLGIFLARLLGIFEIFILSFCGLAFVVVGFLLSRYATKIEVLCKVLPIRVNCFDSANLEIELITQKNQRGLGRTLEIKNLQQDGLDSKPVFYSMEGEDKLNYEIRTNVRGPMTFGPLVLEFTDPFGLVQTQKKTNTTCTLLVHPYVYQLTPPVFSSRYQPENESAFINQGTEFYALKDYQPGDDYRHIHWQSTAKQGTLMIRQNVAEAGNTILLSLFLDNRPGVSKETFEEMISAVASLAQSAQLRGDDVLLITAGGERVRSNQNEILDFLAHIQQMKEHIPLNLMSASRADISVVFLGKLTEVDKSALKNNKAELHARHTRHCVVYSPNSFQEKWEAGEVQWIRN